MNEYLPFAKSQFWAVIEAAGEQDKTSGSRGNAIERVKLVDDVSVACLHAIVSRYNSCRQVQNTPNE